MKPKADRNASLALDFEDEQTIEFLAALRKNSMDALETAARQIIGLVTTLLGLFFGILAFKDSPTYLIDSRIKLLGTLAAVSYFVSLFGALAVVLPRALDVPKHDLTAMKELIKKLLKIKGGYLFISQTFFAFATLMLLILIVALLYRI
jgi:hypothetical protein